MNVSRPREVAKNGCEDQGAVGITLQPFLRCLSQSIESHRSPIFEGLYFNSINPARVLFVLLREYRHC